jgi:hypothetical protein
MEFETQGHSYTRNGTSYTPVSTLIKRITPDFPAGVIAQAVAKKSDRSVEDVLDEWRLKSEMACDLGNAVDKALDLYVKYKQESKHPFLQKAVEDFRRRSKDKVKSQIVVYDDDLQIAGTIDQIAITEEGLIIRDIKTNGDLFKENKQKFKAPLDDLEATKINTYRIQLSCYKEMLEKMTGKKVIGLELWHYTNDFEIISLKPIETICQKLTSPKEYFGTKNETERQSL